MVQSVLGSLILGYRPLWNRARKLAGVQLYVHNESSLLVDAGHLLRTLAELWSASSPPLLISPQRTSCSPACWKARRAAARGLKCAATG